MDYHEKCLDRYLQKIRLGEFSTPANNKKLLEFHKYCQARGISAARQSIIFSRLLSASHTIGKKDFSAWNRRDVVNLLSTMQQKGYLRRTKASGGLPKRGEGHMKPCMKQHPYKRWSIETTKNVLRTFLRWLNDGKTPEWVGQLLKRERIPTELTAEDLLSPKQILQIINAARTPMWKGWISVLTSGCRPGEAYGIKLGDVHDQGNKIKIYVAGKTKKIAGKRAVYVFPKFTPYLRAWLLVHPRKETKESKENGDFWLFVKPDGERVQYGSLDPILKKITMKAIGKPISAYRFRHSVATILYGKYGGVTARRVLGHGPEMENTYLHFSEEDLENLLEGKSIKNADLGFDDVKAVLETEDKEKFRMELFAYILERMGMNEANLLEMTRDFINKKKG